MNNTDIELDDFNNTCIACDQIEDAIKTLSDNMAIHELLDRLIDFTEQRVLERVNLQQKGLAERAAKIEDMHIEKRATF